MNIEDVKKVLLDGTKYVLFLFVIVCFLRIQGIATKVRHSFSESYSRDRIRNILSFYSAKRFLLEMSVGISVATAIQVFLFSVAFYLARVGFTLDLRIPSDLFETKNLIAIFITIICLMLITTSFCMMAVWSGLQQHEDKSMILNFVAIFKTMALVGFFATLPVVIFNEPGIRFLGGSVYVPFFDDLRVIGLAVIGKPNWQYFASMVLFHSLFTAFMFLICLGKFARLYQSYRGSIVNYLFSYIVRGERAIVRN